MEDRTVPATITWVNSGSGNWDVGSNWNTGTVPGSGDTAVINTAAAVTVTIKSGDTIGVQSVTTGGTDALVFTGGSLEVTTGASVLSGGLSMTGGTLTVNGAGTSLTANGTTSVSGASLYAQSGGALSLPNLTATTFSFGNTYEATGTNSRLDLAALTSYTQTGAWSLDAYNGGVLNVSGLSGTLNGTFACSFNDTGASQIIDPNITGLNDFSCTLDGSDANVASNWTSFVDGQLQVEYGTCRLPNLTTVTDSSLQASNGGKLSLPGLTTVTFGFANTFEATGTGSLLNVSALTSFTQTNGFNIDAYNGGTLNLSGLRGCLKT